MKLKPGIRLSGALCALTILLAGSAHAAPKDPPVERVKQLALKQCLDDNYERLKFYKAYDLHDASYFVDRVQLDRDGTDRRTRALSQFIKQQTGSFHVGGPSMKNEAGYPINAIFERCMGFYHSPGLEAFIKNQLLKP